MPPLAGLLKCIILLAHTKVVISVAHDRETKLTRANHFQGRSHLFDAGVGLPYSILSKLVSQVVNLTTLNIFLGSRG